MFKGHPDGQHVPIHNQYAQEAEQNMVRTDSNLDYEASGNGHRGNCLDSNISQGLDANLVPSANGDGKVYCQNDDFNSLLFYSDFKVQCLIKLSLILTGV